MKPNLINLYPNVARAVQIAIAGKHTLVIDGEAQQVLRRVCDSHTSARIYGLNDVGFPTKNLSEGLQMFVTAELPPDHSAQELIKRLYDNNDNPFDKWRDDAEILQHRITSVGMKLSPGAAAIFDTAVKKYNATLQEQINCIEVARTIQGLELIDGVRVEAKGCQDININEINAECIAEALHYTIINVPREGVVSNEVNDEGRV